MAEAAKHKHELDILNGNLWTSIPAFALPVAATGILEQLSTLIDTAMVGHLLGAEGEVATAAVSSNTPIISMMLNLFIGISLGTNVVIAHAVGAGEQDKIHKAVHTSVLLSLVGIAVTIVGELFAEPLLSVLNVPAETLPHAMLFLRVYMLGMPSILLYNFEAAIFRSVGITKMPLQALLVSSLINIALLPVFVGVCGWGTGGAAAATAVSYTVAAAYLFYRLTHTNAVIRLDIAQVKIDAPTLRHILSIGVPAGVQGAVFSIANVVMQSCINSLGTEVMAASGAVLSIEYVMYQLLNSFSQAGTTFVGQNYGAHNIARCKHTLFVSLIEAEVINLVVVVTLFFFGRNIVGLFLSVPDETVIELGYFRMMTIFPSYTFSMAYENLSGYMRGYGVSTPPAIITAICVCGSRFLWAGLVFPANPTFETVMAIYPISLALTATCIFILLMVIRPAKTLGGEKAEV